MLDARPTPPDSWSQDANVTLVIVTHNGMRWIDELLASIRSQDYPEITTVLVDNDSHDGCLPHVQHQYPWVRAISAGGNLGFGAAANLGASFAAGAFVAFLNEDMRLERSAIRHLVEKFIHLSKSRRVGIICAQEVGYFPPHALHNLGWKLDWLGFSAASSDLPPEGHGRSTFFYAPGAPCLMQTKLFQEVDGFEELFFLYFEDTDLSWKVRLLGYDIAVCTEAVVYHAGGGITTSRPALSRVELLQRNRLLLLWKNYSLPHALLASAIAIPHAIFFAVLYALTEFGVGYLTCTVRAIAQAMLLFPQIHARRRFIQSRRRVSDRTVRCAMSTRYLGPSLLAGAYRLLFAHRRQPQSPPAQ